MLCWATTDILKKHMYSEMEAHEAVVAAKAMQSTINSSDHKHHLTNNKISCCDVLLQYIFTIWNKNGIRSNIFDCYYVLKRN